MLRCPRIRNKAPAGSFTIETALLMPLLLLSLLTLLFLCLHLHDRSVLTAYAAENAVSGRENALPYLVLSEAEAPVFDERNGRRTVSVRLRTPAIPFVPGAAFFTEESAVTRYPAKEIRLAMTLAAGRKEPSS